MPNSNNIFFQASQESVTDNTGYEIRIYASTDFTTLVGVINQYVDLSFSLELNGVGFGSVALRLDSPFWSGNLPNGLPVTDILNKEYLFKVFEDGVERGSWVGQKAKVIVVSTDSEEIDAVQISGPGPAHVLDWAHVFPPGFPKSTAFFWEFKDTPIMSAYLTLLEASQARGTITYVDPLFTATKDSAGNDWVDVASPSEKFIPDLDIDLLTLLDVVTGQDLDKQASIRAEWFMWPDFKLDVRPVIGNYRQNSVIFFEAQLLTKETDSVRNDIRNYVGVRDNHGNISLAFDEASITKWQQRETLQQRGTVTDQVRRDRIAQIVLEQHKDEKKSLLVKVPYGLPNRRVFKDYNIGDWIGFSSLTSSGSEVEEYRVVAIAVNVDVDGEKSLELTLISRLDILQRRLHRNLTQIINTVGRDSLKDRPDVHIPTLPDYRSPLVWNPNRGWFELGNENELGGGSGGGIQVFIQPDDPGGLASTGDMWLDTS